MKVLHLWRSASLDGGGGGLSMGRLHGFLRAAGVDSAIMSLNAPTAEPHMFQVPRWRIAEGALRRITEPLGLNDVHRISSFALKHEAAFRQADVLHFHGMHSGFLSYLALPTLTRGTPAVFTLHDMWALTGHCAISYGCERWRQGCGSCPHPEAHPRIERDATRVEWRLKRRAFARSRLIFVSVSKQMARQAAGSLPGHVRCIPNGVDTETFTPMAKRLARRSLHLPEDKIVIMSGAVSFGQRHKGLDLLEEAVSRLPSDLKAASTILLVGGGQGCEQSLGGIPTIRLGRIYDRAEMALAYNAADIFVLPSRYEPFGLVLLESMACGTPVIAFDVGGVSDIVQPGVNGELVVPEDTRRMSEAIASLVTDDSRRVNMGVACRRMALEHFSGELEAQRYISVYRQLVGEGQQQGPTQPHQRPTEMDHP